MASTITTSVVTGGSNSHATTSAEVNAIATDFIHSGVSGPITLNSGSGGTGSFCVNAQGTPAMFVDVKAGSAWITATPTGQTSQKLRAYMSADYTSYAISSNASGSTKYDWIYLKVDPTAANSPASDASDVTSLYTSRSSSNSTDNGSPPTYGVLLAVVTVANGASSITNSNISDKRTTATFRSSPATSGVNSLDISTAAASSSPTITAQGSDANIDINFATKGTGKLKGVVNNLFNPYKFSVYRNAALNATSSNTLIQYDAKEYDTGSNVDIVTNKGRFTAPIAGFYHFNARVDLSSTLGAIFLYKNGAEFKRGNDLRYTGVTGLVLSVDVQAAANDYFEIYVLAGGTVAMATGAALNYFQGFLISAT